MGFAEPSILDGLLPRPAPSRRALVVPVLSGFRPGLRLYEDLVGLVRKVDLDVFGLTTAFGPLPESHLIHYPEILGFAGDGRDPEVAREGAIRTRTWSDRAPEVYRKIVLLSYGPAMRVWSESVGGSRGAPLVEIVAVAKSQGGFEGNTLRRRLSRAMA